MDIKKMRTLISRGGEIAGMGVVDLVWVDDVPYAVFEWQEMPDGTHDPVRMVMLDAQGLVAFPSAPADGITHQYRLAIEEPGAGEHGVSLF
ncbi:MAG: hypothetical protein LBK01_06115 [Burkholderiaceae bacterium]|nr:hypothetical protein [Burkholderiaceae bacterium]